MEVLLDLRALTAGVWLLFPPDGEGDLSLCGDDEGDFCFFLSSFFTTSSCAM